MRDVLDAVTADVGLADARRQKMRADYPAIARVVDDSKGCARVRHITVDGVTVAGKAPEADPASWVTLRGEFVAFACAWGRK